MSDSPASQRRRAFIERIERLEEDRKALADDIASVYDELKADGHDKAAIKIIVKIRRKEDGLSNWIGQSGTVDEYLADLGMLPKGEEARAGARVRENIEQFPPHDPLTGELTDTQEQPETADEVPAQDGSGTATGESPSGKSHAAHPVSEQELADADLNDGTAAGQTAIEVVTAGETASHSPSPASAPRLAADDEAAQANPIAVGTLPNPQPTSSPAIADEAEANSPPASAALSEAEIPQFLKADRGFNNPRCKHPDTCSKAHSKDTCLDCTLAWADLPKAEQVLRWQDAVAASETEAA